MLIANHHGKHQKEQMVAFSTKYKRKIIMVTIWYIFIFLLKLSYG